jgi:PIN domain nuclease of toxin-antitoxin system
MPTADRVLLDTHVLLWWKADRSRLSAAAAEQLDGASQVLISPVSCWEVGMLIAKGRVQLDRPTRVWIEDVLAPARIGIAELTPSTAVAAAELHGFHGDPADRFIVATASAMRVPLVTKDRLIHAYAQESSELVVVW